MAQTVRPQLALDGIARLREGLDPYRYWQLDELPRHDGKGLDSIPGAPWMVIGTGRASSLHQADRAGQVVPCRTPCLSVGDLAAVMGKRHA